MFKNYLRVLVSVSFQQKGWAAAATPLGVNLPLFLYCGYFVVTQSDVFKVVVTIAWRQLNIARAWLIMNQCLLAQLLT